MKLGKEIAIGFASDETEVAEAAEPVPTIAEPILPTGAAPAAAGASPRQ